MADRARERVDASDVLDALIIGAAATLLPQAESWYMGANIPGKPRRLLHHPGLQVYLAFCQESAAAGYSGFELIGRV